MAEPNEYAPSGQEMSEEAWLADLKAGDDTIAVAASAMKIYYAVCGEPHPIPDDLWHSLAKIALKD